MTVGLTFCCVGFLQLEQAELFFIVVLRLPVVVSSKETGRL